MQRISVIVTILNEQETIVRLLEALRDQSAQADEIIILDGGSDDQTLLRIKAFKHKHPDFPLQVYIKKGNRSVGRNEAISKAENQIIAITDAGCIPHHNWLEELTRCVEEQPELKKNMFVVAGYYDAVIESDFQEAVVPYVLVMPDKVNPKTFLPATRSMMLSKNVWRELGGFDESLSDNEDYAFAKKIQQENIPIFFTEKAKVLWMPTSNIFLFAKMIFRFARGDIFAGIVRPKVVFLFFRYSIFLMIFLGMWWQFHLNGAFYVLFSILFFYSLWAVLKNQKYVENGWYYLPLLQFVADFAVMRGSIAGWLQKRRHKTTGV